MDSIILHATQLAFSRIADVAALTHCPLILSITDVTPLAQSADPGPILFWSLVLILLLVGAFMGVMYLRKWVRDDSGDSESEKLGFTLGDLRRLRDGGRLSDEEYEKARTQMIAATRRAAERAAEAARQAKERGGAGDTDVDALRARAKRNRELSAGQPTGEPDPPADSPDPPPA